MPYKDLEFRKEKQREYCRTYYSKNKKKFQKRNTERKRSAIKYVFEYLSKNPCIDCGEDDPIVLEFDHVDPKTKLTTISRLIPLGTIERIQEEIDKCVVRCANCHRRKTAKDQNWLMLELKK